MTLLEALIIFLIIALAAGCGLLLEWVRVRQRHPNTDDLMLRDMLYKLAARLNKTELGRYFQFTPDPERWRINMYFDGYCYMQFHQLACFDRLWARAQGPLKMTKNVITNNSAIDTWAHVPLDGWAMISWYIDEHFEKPPTISISGSTKRTPALKDLGVLYKHIQQETHE